MRKLCLIILSFLFIISNSNSVFSNIEGTNDDSMEQADTVISEEQIDPTEVLPEGEQTDSTEVSIEEDKKLLEELSSPNASLFHAPSSLRTNVDFWKRIYTEFTTNQMVIHDIDNLDIIYDVVNINGSRMGKGRVNEVRRKYKSILISIHNKIKSGKALNSEEIEVYKKFDNIYKPNKFIIASNDIRGQLGQRDRFIEGLKRSGRYIDNIKEIFRNHGLPEELTALPHVESSFNYEAFSSAGAAGIWQFTRSTGRLFMQIDYVIDERRDPIFSTVAAAKLLKRNYEELGNWPLAIIAYNHGLHGMKRAKKRIGDDVTDVINGYKSRIFGFASKNFYCEFLAALEIVKDYKKYFGEIEFEKPVEYDVFKVESYLDIITASKHLGLHKDEIKKLNPALRPPVFTSKKYIPKGFELKVPKGKLPDIYNIYASLPKDARNQTQKHSQWYRIDDGDTLSTIARRHNITVAAIMEINDIDNINRIYQGQTLKLPESFSGQGKGKKESKPQYQNVARVAVKPVREELKTKPAHEDGKKVESVNPETKTAVQLNSSPVFLKTAYEVTPSNSDAKGSNYGFIKVELDETTGHYADWSNIPVHKIKDINGLRRRAALRIGQNIKIPFTAVSKEEFEEKRAEHHMAIQEDFFSNYKVEGTAPYAVKRGETIWKLCAENEIPLWLLKRYNPEKNLQKLARGESIILPVVTKIN